MSCKRWRQFLLILLLATRPALGQSPQSRAVGWLSQPSQSVPAAPLAAPPVYIPPAVDDPWYRDSKFAATWLPGDGDQLGMTDLEKQITFYHPPYIPLAVTPGFGVHFLDGPSSTDLPPRLHDAFVDVAGLLPLGDWQFELAVRPGLYGDYDTVNQDTLRIQGRVIGIRALSPTVKLVAGVIYLDRQDLPVVPAGGVIWTPSPDQKFELALPRPRIAQRIWAGVDIERWIYLAGELGGNTWSIRRSDGTHDVMSYRDYRLIAGVETVPAAGLETRLEVGYVFSRHLEYGSNTPDFSPGDTVLIRAGFKY